MKCAPTVVKSFILLYSLKNYRYYQTTILNILFKLGAFGGRVEPLSAIACLNPQHHAANYPRLTGSSTRNTQWTKYAAITRSSYNRTIISGCQKIEIRWYVETLKPWSDREDLPPPSFLRYHCIRGVLNPEKMDYTYLFEYFSESWIEISSQPSSSSLSSAGTGDIGPATLRLQHSSNARRRRRPNPNVPTNNDPSVRPTSAAGSSQEEYEESESEPDPIMSSSNEGFQPQYLREDTSPAAPSTTSEEVVLEEDDDENSTALGISNNQPVFTPQPNAFSHPPVFQQTRRTHSAGTQGSSFPTSGTTSARSTAPRHSYPSQRTRSHTPYNVISPTYQADHDAALRASLSTLLSCAAAARGLPKREQPAQRGVGPSNMIEPSTLRLIPESSITEENIVTRRPVIRRLSDTSSSVQSLPGKGKRKASSRDRRDTKKKRQGSVDEMMISPTLMTWVVSAGVVVLFSAISFSAGFAYGKEVGLVEAGMTTGSDGMACGKEMGRSIRRLRWGTTPTSVRV